MPYLPRHYSICNSNRDSIVYIDTANHFDSIINVDTATNVCFNITANDVDTLCGILTSEVVLDYKQPYSYGTHLHPKQLGV